MVAQLPLAFINRMQMLMGDEYDSFLSSYHKPKYVGIRVNTLKISVEDFVKISPFELKPIPWCATGFYVYENVKPGKHPYYHAGLYYIQEPSAMSPAEALNVIPGDRVLDLCAAPGGKSTQIGAKLQGKGVLVTNDISADRTKALAKNIELYGIKNAVVLNETPDRIAESFPNYFNKIVIDAPCSGEGMFRKDEDMVRQWGKHSVEKCTLMQRDILSTAALLLSPGGTIVYSTCTFAPEENEAMIAEFLQKHPDYQVIPLPDDLGFSSGRPEWIPESIIADDAAKAQTAYCARLWPHKIEGEGHFLAVLRHTGEESSTMSKHLLEGDVSTESEPVQGRDRNQTRDRYSSRERDRARHTSHTGKKNRDRHSESKKGANEQEMVESWTAFASEQLALKYDCPPLLIGGNVYLSPLTKDRLNGLKIVRPGWYVGTVKYGRFQPGHPLATALHEEEAVRVLELSSDKGEAVHYLKGETLEISQSRIICQEGISNPKGYVLVTIDGYSLGWGKWVDGLLKNEYPAGWRWT